MRRAIGCAAAWIAFASGGVALAQGGDPRLREVTYDARAVVEIPVKRGVVTDIVLGADEGITDVASGLGADCAKVEDVWCVAAKAGGRHLFVKPKSGATAPNTLAVITEKRLHSFTLVVLADGDARPPAYRLNIRAASAVAARPAPESHDPTLLPASTSIAAETPIAERLQAPPQVVNSSYSIAEGTASGDIVPTLVFDDGRFTYLRFPGNREVPAVFEVRADASESFTNARMEGDLLVVDRVGRQFVLRSGTAVVAVWNDAFDIEGAPPSHGTTVPGVERAVRSQLGARQRSTP